METSRRGFLKIMAAGVVAATVPIPVLAKGVIAKPWPVGEPRIVYFRMVELDPEMDFTGVGHGVGFGAGMAVVKSFMICSAVVASQEDMDAIEQQKTFHKWFPDRQLQLDRMLEEPPVPSILEIAAGRTYENR